MQQEHCVVSMQRRVVPPKEYNDPDALELWSNSDAVKNFKHQATLFFFPKTFVSTQKASSLGEKL